MKIRNAHMTTIHAQARAEYPAECCGIITSNSEGDLEVHVCENIQDRLHQQDPEQYPRDARIAYYIDPQELYDIVMATEKSGGGVAGLYHSHIDCDAYFSQEDKERAMAWDEPAYPDAVYLVVSVNEGEVGNQRCFGWDEESRGFVEVELEVTD